MPEKTRSRPPARTRGHQPRAREELPPQGNAPVVLGAPGPQEGDAQEPTTVKIVDHERAESSTYAGAVRAKPTQPGGAGAVVPGRQPGPSPAGGPDAEGPTIGGLMREAWTGYRMYHNVVFNLTEKGAGQTKGPSVRLIKEMGASCFWIALFAAYRTEDCPKFWNALCDARRDVTLPVDVVEAIQILEDTGLDVSVFWHNIMDGSVEQMYVRTDSKLRFQPGVMHVLFDDKGEYAPHWLPISTVKDDPSPLHFTMQQLQKKAAKRMPIPEVAPSQKGKECIPQPSPERLPIPEVAPSQKGQECTPQPSPEPAVEQPTFVPYTGYYDILLGLDEREQEDEGAEDWLDNCELETECGEESTKDPASAAPSAPPSEASDELDTSTEWVEAAIEKKVQVIEEPKLPKAKRERQEKTAGRSNPLHRPDRSFMLWGRGTTAVPGSVKAPKPAHVRHQRNQGKFTRGAYFLGEWQPPAFAAAYGRTPPPCPKHPHRPRTRWFGGDTDESCFHAIAEAESYWTQGWLSRRFEKVLFEAEKSMIVGKHLAVGDWLYERVAPDHGVNPNLSATGSLRLDLIESIECERLVLSVGKIETYRDGEREYRMAPLEYHASVGWGCSDIGALFGFARKKARRIGIRTQTVPCLTLDTLAALPTVETRVRAMYTLIKPLIPEAVRGPLNDVRNVHLSLKEELGDTEPIAVAKAMTEAQRAVESRLQRVPAFGHKQKRVPKSCVSCGQSPPAEKYRWKHRICTACRKALESRGYTTWSGYQVQQNLHVPTCYPGLVYVWPEQFPPAQKKWAITDLGGQDPRKWWVKADVRAMKAKLGRENAPKALGTLWEGDKNDLLDRLAKLPLPDAKPSHALGGIGCSGARPMVSAKTAYNCYKSLVGRTFLQLDRQDWAEEGGPKPGIWPKMAKEFVPYLLPDFRAATMCFMDWLATMPKHRQPALLRAWQRLERTGWLHSMAAFGCFVKLEFLPGFGKVEGDLVRLVEMLDRLINGPSDESHCIVGPVVKPLVKRLKEIWGPEDPIFYGSAGPAELHKFLQILASEESQYFWCDFSMYDRTHSDDSWDFMEGLYPEAGALFEKVMKVWRCPQGRIGPFAFKAKVCNASGRDDTALANGILNGFATFTSACAAWLSIEVEDLTVEDLKHCVAIGIKLSVCGDDSLGRLPMCSEAKMTDFRRRFNAQIVKFGFKAKLCTSPHLVDAVYLGQRPYPTDKGWFWGKTIGRATYKMGWVMLKDGRDPMAHVTGIADLHVQCSSHVPVLADLAEKIVELRQGAKRTPVPLDPNKPWEWTLKSGVKYNRQTLAAVAEAYSRRDTPGNEKAWEREVLVEDVEDLIREIRSIERLPAVIDHWLWKHMIFADDL